MAIFNVTIEVNNDLSLEILFHLASLLSLCIFFAPTLKELMVNNYLYIVKHKREYKGDFKYLLCLCIASVPAGIVGILLKDKIELLFSDVIYVGISLIVTSLILYITYKLPNKNKDLTYKRAFIIGLFQSVGIIPGISRSGVTYLGAKGVGIENKKASECLNKKYYREREYLYAHKEDLFVNKDLITLKDNFLELNYKPKKLKVIIEEEKLHILPEYTNITTSNFENYLKQYILVNELLKNCDCNSFPGYELCRNWKRSITSNLTDHLFGIINITNFTSFINIIYSSFIPKYS